MCFRDNSPILRRTGSLIETPVFYEHLSDADNLRLDFANMEKDGIDAVLVLRQVGLPGTGDRPVSAFSLGMRQRLAIARAIVHRPEALFPLCSDRLTAGTALWSLGFFLCCSILAGLLGSLSLWFGFRKRSVPVTIVSAFSGIPGAQRGVCISAHSGDRSGHRSDPCSPGSNGSVPSHRKHGGITRWENKNASPAISPF